jgi:hypothetical protein
MQQIESNDKSYLNLLLATAAVLLSLSSCVPIAIGAAGAAAGYIARDQGVGVVEPVGSDSSSGTYDEPVY